MKRKIALVGRRDLHSVPGGDTLQMVETAAELRSRGYQVDILDRGIGAGASAYDLAHLFNITRIHDTLARAREWSRAGVPIVLTPIHHALIWLDQYERAGRIGVAGRIVRRLDRDNREAGKAIYHAIRQPSQIRDCLSLLRTGYSDAQREVLERSRLVVCNSEAELAMLRSELDFTGPARVSYLGLSTAFQRSLLEDPPSAVSPWENDLPFLLSVGRIEPRKGQLLTVEVARNLGLGLVLIGAPSKISPGYFRLVEERASALPAFLHIGKASQGELVGWYRNAAAHVLASWFETVGLVTLEAVACGCPSATTNRSYIEEYLGDSSVYVEPGDFDLLLQGVTQALAQGRQTPEHMERARSYTWKRSVDALEAAYEEALG